MSVHQVDQYYIHMIFSFITEEQKNSIVEYLSNEGLSNYEFQDDNATLVVDDFESEADAQNVEEGILAILE